MTVCRINKLLQAMWAAITILGCVGLYPVISPIARFREIAATGINSSVVIPRSRRPAR